MYSNSKDLMNASDITLVLKGVLYSDNVKKMNVVLVQGGSARKKIYVPYALGYVFVSDKAVVVQQCDLCESSCKEGMRKVVRKQVLPNQPFTLAPIELSALMKTKTVRVVTEMAEEVRVLKRSKDTVSYVYSPVSISDKYIAEMGIPSILIETCTGVEYNRFHDLVNKIRGKIF